MPSPAGPGSPSGPDAPARPCGPGGPGGPSAPCGPGRPAGPGSPLDPTAPAGPCGPVLHSHPSALGDCNPGSPGTDCGSAPAPRGCSVFHCPGPPPELGSGVLVHPPIKSSATMIVIDSCIDSC